MKKRMHFLCVFVFLVPVLSFASAGPACPSGPPLEEVARTATLIFRGLAIQTDPPTDPKVAPPPGFRYAAQFWLISVYKGSRDLARFLHFDPDQLGSLDIKDRRVNVTGFSGAGPECWAPVTSQKYYLVLASMTGKELTALEGSPVLDWSQAVEDTVWRAVGWSQWTDWAACSVSCGDGSQQRWRYCLSPEGCEGSNTESRRCNSFACQGAVSPLVGDQRRFFHGQWDRAPDRQTAWRLRPNVYLWLPAAELTGITRHLKKHFALLFTLRLNPKEPGAGTLFSLRSRRQQNAYLSVELAGKGAVKLVHASPDGIQTVLIPAALGDGHWHQLAIGVQQDSSVRSYLDCKWISTDILRRDSLDIPEDANVVIGYLFSGDLEQLVIVPDSGAVSQQCSASQVSSFDPAVTAPPPPPSRPGKQAKKHLKKQIWSPEKENEIWEDDEDFFEGSGGGAPLENYEYEWTEWSRCSVTCGLGVQTRRVSCTETGVWLERCLESSQDKTESRPCNAAPCGLQHDVKSNNVTESEGRKACECDNGGTCHVKRRACHCPTGFQGRHCEIRTCPGPCLHGGVCHNSGVCSCPPEYTGETCQTPVCRPPCMNGGQCVKPGVCSCPNEFDHPQCASMCPGRCEPGGACVSPGICQCLPGFYGSLCQESLCPRGCLNGGHCVSTNQCVCANGWTGQDCSSPVCEPSCQRGGRCVAPQQCLCPENTLGLYCQNFTCPGGCYNGGVCVGPGLCECPVNATGPRCSQPICDPPCENGATCGPGNTCICAPHTSGTRCQTRNCDYRFVQEPYTRGFRKLVKKPVETNCGPGPKMCWRTVAEYQTVYKTFYRTVYKCVARGDR